MKKSNRRSPKYSGELKLIEMAEKRTEMAFFLVRGVVGGKIDSRPTDAKPGRAKLIVGMVQ